MSNMRTEQWCGYSIRFIEINGEWYAILKDICDALGLKTFDVSKRIGSDMLERVRIDTSDNLSGVDRSNMVSTRVRSNVISNDLKYEHQPIKAVTSQIIGKDIGRRPGDNKTRWMLAVNESGIYEALFASRKLEARKFRRWAGTVMQKLRKSVGLEGYEVMRMTEPEIQDQIDDILDTLFWDDEKKMLMRSVTIQGGDVDQVPFV